MYATAQDLQDRYPAQDLIQLTDPDGAVLDESRLVKALNDASAEIDGYLQGRYTLPLVEVPKVLEVMACDIAMYRLQVNRPLGSVEDSHERYKAAIAYLRDVSRGNVQLGLSDNDASPAEGSGPEVISGDRRFSQESMRGY